MRGISGFGAGALNALVQISISDFTRLEERGYYFGIVGIAVGLGNGLGPLIGGALTEAAGWRWAFWFICPLAVVAVVYLMLVMPGSGTREGWWGKIRRVDWVGVGFSMVAVVLVLVSG
jgi:MFS family permease